VVDGLAFAFEIKFPAGHRAHKDVCLAAADDVTRQRCVRIIEAASAGGASPSLPDIAKSAALTRGLLDMNSFVAVKAVFSALGVAMDHPSLKAVGFDRPSLKAAGFDLAAYRAAGCDWTTIRTAGFSAVEAQASGCDLASAQAAGFNVPSLVAAYGYKVVAAAGIDVSCILVSFLLCLRAHTRAQTSPPSSSFQCHRSYFYATLHCHKVHDRTLVFDGDQPLHVPEGWHIAPGDADDIHVGGAYPWQSYNLHFANRTFCGTARWDRPSHRGTYPRQSYRESKKLPHACI
jgi:hypothetical protein